ncbi:MAG: lipid kinase [Rhodospirillales bacterium]|nr:lipid kinase [Rhodospirillales bacterium]
MAHRRALLVINRRSRQGESDLSRPLALLAEHGVLVDVEPVEDPSSIPAVIEARAQDIDIVIVAGGDGTVNAAVDQLVRHGLPLGVLPLGTANDLARTLCIPANLEEASEVIAAGRRHEIDLGWVNGKHFLNVASIGLSVSVAEELTADVKRRWGPLSYLISAARVLRNTPPFRARIQCDKRILRMWATQVAVGNGRYYGGGMTVAEEARIDDGTLHLYAIKPRRLLDYVALLPALRRGRHKHSQGVHVAQGTEIEVITRPRLPINTDGEVTTKTPGHFRVVPRALAVFVPAAYGRRQAGASC